MNDPSTPSRGVPEFRPADLLSQGLALGLSGVMLLFYVVSLVRVVAGRDGLDLLPAIGPVLVNACVYGLLAIGLTVVMAARGVDFSLPMVGLIGGAVAVRLGLPAAAALVVAVIVGGVLGAINGALAGLARIPAYLATLVTAVVLAALAPWLTGGAGMLARGLEGLGGPGSALIVLLLGAGGSYALLTSAGFGERMREVGRAAAGHGSPALIGAGYVFAACLAAVALSLQIGTIRFVTGTYASFPVTLAAIAAALIGGASVYGGRGSVLGSVLGGVAVALLLSGLTLWRADPVVQSGLVGLIALAFLAWDILRHRWVPSLA